MNDMFWLFIDILLTRQKALILPAPQLRGMLEKYAIRVQTEEIKEKTVIPAKVWEPVLA